MFLKKHKFKKSVLFTRPLHTRTILSAFSVKRKLTFHHNRLVFTSLIRWCFALRICRIVSLATLLFARILDMPCFLFQGSLRFLPDVFESQCDRGRACVTKTDRWDDRGRACVTKTDRKMTGDGPVSQKLTAVSFHDTDPSPVILSAFL